MKRIFATLAAVGLLAGCTSARGAVHHHAAASKSADPVTVVGSVTVKRASIMTEDGPGTVCWTDGNAPAFGSPSPYDDVKAGAQVVITDASGKTLALGKLGDGTAVGASSETADCRFDFTIYDVPGGSSFYGIKVGTEQSQQFPAAALPSAAVSFG